MQDLKKINFPWRSSIWPISFFIHFLCVKDLFLVCTKYILYAFSNVTSSKWKNSFLYNFIIFRMHSTVANCMSDLSTRHLSQIDNCRPWKNLQRAKKSHRLRSSETIVMAKTKIVLYCVFRRRQDLQAPRNKLRYAADISPKNIETANIEKQKYRDFTKKNIAISYWYTFLVTDKRFPACKSIKNNQIAYWRPR